MKKIVVFLFFGLQFHSLFCQQQTYMAKYICTASNIDEVQRNIRESSPDTVLLKMKFELEVISNDKYAKITTKLLEFNLNNKRQEDFPDNGKILDEILVDFTTNTHFWCNEDKAFQFEADTLLHLTDTKNIGAYDCNLLQPADSSLKHINIWVSKKLPWYINPGVWGDRNISGVVRIEGDEKVTELIEVKETKYDFSLILNKVKNRKIQKSNSGKLDDFF